MIDFVIVSGYLIFMLGLGWRHRRQSENAYWIAERRYAAPSIAVSLVMTIFGASSVMGVIGLGYANGLTGAWWSLTGALALVPFSFFMAGRVRALGVYTLPDILKNTYGLSVSVPASLVIVVAWCGIIAAQLVAAGLLVADALNIQNVFALFLVTCIFTVYTFWGGQNSVVRTDRWQLLVFTAGLLISLAFMINHSRAHPPVAALPADLWRFPVSGTTGVYRVLVFYPLIVGLPYLVGPDIYSRILCARDSRSARRAALTASVVVMVLAFVLAGWGMMARRLFPDIAAETALSRVLNGLLPAGVKGLVMAGFLAALMSSADTCLVSASTIFTLNVVDAFPGFPARYRLITTKLGVVFIAAMAFLIAVSLQGIIDSLLLGYGIFVAGVAAPTLAALFKSRVPVYPAAALCATILGGSTAVLGNLYGEQWMFFLFTPTGAGLIKTLFGPGHLSIFPFFLSVVALLGVSAYIHWRTKNRS